MDKTVPGKMELVGVTHVVDAITFWAQNVNDDPAVERMTSILSARCPTARRLTGNPSPQKLYGALFSEDRCWYRCKVQHNNDDKFTVCYIDYGNTELVSRSSLVELPEDLQMGCLAKKYKFWGFHLNSDEDSQHFVQGKIFLRNLIYGKKLRIQKKSVCFDGTVLVHAFQGDLDIGEEVMKMKFAKLSIPGCREGSNPTWQDPLGPWGPRTPEHASQGDTVQAGSQVLIPKPRPTFPEHVPQALKEKSTTTALQPASLLKKKLDQELMEENERLKEEKSAQYRSALLLGKELTEAQVELQRMKDSRLRDAIEIQKLKEENGVLRQKADELGRQLRDVQQELQATKQQVTDSVEAADKRLESAVGDKLGQLAQKVESLRGVREARSRGTFRDSLLEAIDIVAHNGISSPASLEKLEAVWKEYDLAQDMVKACREIEDLEELIAKRNGVRGTLAVAVDDFIQEVDGLPISKRMDTLEAVGASLTAVFGSFSMEGAGDETFERFRQWNSQKQQETRAVEEETDETLKFLCSWFEKMVKFFSLSSELPIPLSVMTMGVDSLLQRAELNLCRELDVSLAEQNSRDMEIVSSAFHSVMQRIGKEQSLLRAVREKYLLNSQFKEEVLRWQDDTPKADELFSIKKHIKNLRSQLRWRLVEQGSLEEAEEVDLLEVEKKKTQIEQTRNALFQEIGLEKEEYKRLAALAKGGFPELPLLYHAADLLSFMNSEGLVVKSLDRDLFASVPLRELSSRRPLVCTEFQGQQVVLKGYSVDAQSEVRTVERATQYYRASMFGEEQTGLLPLLALFFGKSDPMAYVMVPYVSCGMLQLVQNSSPLNTSEIAAVMRGVALGLQTLHGSGVIHGSLHPSNVFVLRRERGLLGDFDFTKDPDQRVADPRMLAGALSLVAPEVAQGEPPSPACDVYALGCLLLWLHFPEVKFALKPDGCLADTSEMKLDPRLRILLPQLLCSSSRRLAASDVLSHDYFSSQ
ncbi:serine/threonine kinase 31 [Brienomyrus brachyistius]|uniref:serine/threonine kinase 31 n=1 Tax=Brienomyrus brachyistius TaxID=42636 RepID=UPI0020B3C5FB|nr:serine/threonine kinase 31 [Brienomyrus brachyistius]XP_048882563.1 serine/threonine kinase 31 [Brienomyrus brachyistius]XP_048882564.1 serine/threonine kinase 31 [Brienomyrus brachyistius]XP_048882565.1 serine/threonine kinase 31 [Brienomyrus brachyistius]